VNFRVDFPWQLQLEDNILRVETQYLEETSAGNIIKGFDNYIKGAATTTTAGGAGTATRRKAPISDADRIFSRSSTSFLRVRREIPRLLMDSQRIDADCTPGILHTGLRDAIARPYPDFVLPYARIEPTYKRGEARRKQEEEGSRRRRR